MTEEKIVMPEYLDARELRAMHDLIFKYGDENLGLWDVGGHTYYMASFDRELYDFSEKLKELIKNKRAKNPTEKDEPALRGILHRYGIRYIK